MTEQPGWQPEETKVPREWFLWVFDMAMNDAIASGHDHDAARAMAWTARRKFDRQLGDFGLAILVPQPLLAPPTENG